jgi:Bacterial Ig domain
MGWTPILWTPTGGQQASPHGNAGSKHARQSYDSVRQRVVIAGGDRYGSDAGQPNIISFVPGSGNFTILRAEDAAGKQPAYPDNCTWVYDSKHDRHIIARSFWFGLAYAKTKQPGRPEADWLTDNGIFDPNTNTYSSTVIPTPPTPGIGWGGDSNSNFGIYDPILNALVRPFWDGSWGFTLQIIPLGDLTTFPTEVHYSVGSGHPSGSFIRNYLRNTDAHARQPALDIEGRAFYVIAKSSTSMLPPGDLGWGLIKIDLDHPTLGERIALPDFYDPQEVGSGDGSDNYLAFDPVRRCLGHPQVQGYSGEVKSGLFYFVDTGEFELLPISGPPYPQGNCFCYAPNVGAFVLTGGRPTGSVMRPGETLTPDHYFLMTPSTEAPLPQLENVRATAVTSPVNVPDTQVAAFYRFTVHDPGNPTPLQTVDTPDPTIRFGDFTGLVVGQTYDFKGVLKKVGGTGEIAAVVKTVTITGEDPDPPDPPPGDSTPPTVTITVPTAGQHITGILTPVFTATDASGILLVETRVNGVLLAPNTGFDTTTLPNGDATLSVRAVDNSTNQNETTQNQTFVVDNPAPPDPPDPEPTPTTPQVIFISPMPEDPSRALYVLWASVPEGFEWIWAGKHGSAWHLATPEEVAEIEAGRVAEKSGSMEWTGTEEDMKAAVLPKYTAWAADVANVANWTLTDAYSDGDGWHHR